MGEVARRSEITGTFYVYKYVTYTSGVPTNFFIASSFFKTKMQNVLQCY